MSNNYRVWYRRLLPTAHKLLLHRDTDKRLRTLVGDVLIIGAGSEPYRELLSSASSVCVTDIGPIRDGIDQIADAHDLPFSDQSFDMVVAIEVFEHLKKPHVAAAELNRVLRPGGSGLITIPFMFHVHGSPDDYQRLTPSGLKTLFSSFEDISIQAFGSRRHVISDIVTTTHPAFASLRFINHIISVPFLPNRPSQDCPSGYVVELRK